MSAQRPWRLPLIRRLPKSSSTSNTATKTLCSRTCLTRNSVTRPSAEQLSSPLFTQEREERGGPKTSVSLFLTKVLLPFFACHSRTGKPVHELSELSSSSREKTKSRNEKRNKQDSPWKNKKMKFSLILERSFRNTNFKSIMMEEVSRTRMELSSLNEVRLIVLLQETNNFDEINYFFMNIIITKSRSSWSSWETFQWNRRIEAISRVYIRWNFEKKIDRRSRHHPWTHR